MSNVCITGISGYLGSRLVTELSKDKNIKKIIGFDVKPMKQENKKVIFNKTDIRDPKIKDIFKDNKVDTVFHLAFVVQPIHDKKLMHEIDFNGTLNILNSSADAGVKQVIVISSTLGYGAYPDNPPLLIEDVHPMRGKKMFPYGDEKGKVDNMVQDFAAKNEKMIITTLRPCTVFGPTVRNYIYRMLFQPKGVSLGTDPEFQFVHEDDFVRACMVAMQKKKGGAFNITGDGTMKTSEISAMIGSKLVPMKPWVVYLLMELLWQCRSKMAESNRGILEYVRYPFVASNEKAKKVLGFKPKYTSKQTLEATIKARDERRKSNG